jgi:hypothetical protein
MALAQSAYQISGSTDLLSVRPKYDLDHDAHVRSWQVAQLRAANRANRLARKRMWARRARAEAATIRVANGGTPPQRSRRSPAIMQLVRDIAALIPAEMSEEDSNRLRAVVGVWRRGYDRRRAISSQPLRRDDLTSTQSLR